MLRSLWHGRDRAVFRSQQMARRLINRPTGEKMRIPEQTEDVANNPPHLLGAADMSGHPLLQHHDCRYILSRFSLATNDLSSCSLRRCLQGLQQHPPCDTLTLFYPVTCRRYSCLVFAVLGEGDVSRQRHPVHLRHLSSLEMNQPNDDLFTAGATGVTRRGRPTQGEISTTCRRENYIERGGSPAFL